MAAEQSDAGTSLASRTDVTPMEVVGHRLVHHDFIEKVKGSVLYAADWCLPGMLHGRIVRSQVPSARIKVDVSEARLPGVAVIITAADVPRNGIIERASGGLGELPIEMPILAEDRVRYVGEPIVLIGAETQQLADEAAERVIVDYDMTPGVFDVDSALAPDAPLVHDEGNVLVDWHIARGDVEAGFSAADVVVEGEYRTQHVEHAYMEPESGTAWVDNDVVTVRASTQVIEHVAELAHILDLPLNKVRLIASYMGGGFGGKEDMTVEPYLALLAWKSRRPVRMIWDRQESITASTKRHPFVMRYKTGATRDGRITAQEVEIVGDAGAYPLLSARILFAGAALACGPYRVPSVDIRSRAVLTNNMPTSAFRGFGAMQVTFGYESQIDRVADALGLDPVTVRQVNFLERGDTLPSGEHVGTVVAVDETLRRAIDGLGDRPRPSGLSKAVGRGFACNMQPYGRTIWFRDHASAWLGLEADGALVIRCGVTDLGAGQAASLCAIAAEILGVPLDRISVYIGDSAVTPAAGGTFASRQLYMSGNAVQAAASDLRALLAPVAAQQLGCSEDELHFANGAITSRRDGGVVTIAEVVDECTRQGRETAVLRKWRTTPGTFDPVAGQGDTFPDYTFGAHAVDVEVDMETGEVRVLRYIACHDVGRAINPLRVEGQIQGGAMQGIGYALSEEIVMEAGQVDSALFSSYLIPNACDVPDVDVEIVESGEGRGPFGARGIGEPPIGPPAPAIASAIASAIGVRPSRLPMSPERVLQLIDSRTGGV